MVVCRVIGHVGFLEWLGTIAVLVLVVDGSCILDWRSNSIIGVLNFK
jgi:hypothetical protein